MTKIVFSGSKGLEEVRGSDNRLNVSSRSDTRAFYISRDEGQGYVLRIEDDDAAAGDLVAYLQNDSDSLSLFVREVHVHSENAATFKIAFGDSTTATGTAVTPVNLNKRQSNAAAVLAFGNGAVGGVTAATFFATMRTDANGDSSESFQDMLILGQNNNIVVEYDTGTTGDVEIDIFFYMDTLD